MNRFLLLLITLAVGTGIQAQQILLDEQFNDGTLGVFTEYSVLGGGQVWTPDSFMDDQFAEMNGFDGGIQDNEDWLISPALDMDQYDGEVLTFETACNFNGPDLELLASNDYDGSSDPNNATWTNLSDQVTWSAGGYEVTPSGEIDLSGITGTGYIAFKYISNSDVDGKLWQVDSIIVKASTMSSISDELAEPELITPPVVRDGQLQFTVLGQAETMSFEIYSMEGRSLRNLTVDDAHSKISIPVADLPRGLYLLGVRSAGLVKGYKFMK